MKRKAFLTMMMAMNPPLPPLPVADHKDTLSQYLTQNHKKLKRVKRSRR